MNPTYLKPGRQVLKILQDAFGSQYKDYFYGDRTLIPQSSLPCIIVHELDPIVDTTETGMDTHRKGIIIKVVFNKKDDWQGSQNLDLTQARIEEAIDKRIDLTDSFGNPASGYDPNCVLGLLRTNFTLGGHVVDQKFSIRYYTERRPEDMYTREGAITFTVSEYVIVPNRT